MKKSFLALAATLSLTAASAAPAPLAAEPVWVTGAEREFNAFYGFSAAFDAKEGDAPELILSAASIARVYVNGRFAAYGPARAAEGYLRLDRWPLKDFVRPGKNILAIEVSNPAVNCFYLPESEGFLLAEVRAADGRLLARTGRDFKAMRLPRVQKTNRLSYQREFGEFYRVTPASYAWRTAGVAGEGLPLSVRPMRTALERGAPYPDFHFAATFAPTRLTKMRRNAAKPLAKSITIESAGRGTFKGFKTEELEVNLGELQRLEVVSNVAAEGKVLPRALADGDGVAFKGASDIAGFPYLEVTCTRPCKVWVMMDEIPGADGLPDFLRMSAFNNAVGWELKEPGRYVLEAFQPTCAGAAHVVVEDGAATLERFDWRTYVNPLPSRASFRSSDPAFDLIFASAGRTLANNAVDLFTDCAGRERGSYFGDTTFTGRGGDVLLGDLTIEGTLYENYSLATEFRDVPKGMIPMCYPGDVVLAQPHWIAAFGLWSAIQLVEYVARSGDQATADRYRARAEGILGWFRAARNADGLLENLPGWVFVEWSRAARFTKGVNYPTNMIYIRFLDALAELYGMKDCAEEAARLRAAVRREAWNGTWFRDQSVRNQAGVLEPQENYTEICQTLAFFSGVATPERDADLWQRVVYGLGPMRPEGAHERIWPSNMLFGFSLRFGMLVNAGLYRRAMDETKVCCLPMAEETGTLWEGVAVRGGEKATTYSLSHGFPCQSAWVIAQSALGLRKIDRKARTVTVATPPADIPLDWADAEIPLSATESATFALRRTDGRLAVDVRLPAGWRLVR